MSPIVDRRVSARLAVEAVGRSHSVARLDIFGSLAEAAADWRCLEGTAPCSPYQTLAWTEAWCATVGAAQRVTPLIVVARDEAGDATVLLPLGLSARNGLRVAQFLGGKDSNSNFGLFRDGANWNAANLRSLLAQAARRARIDAFVLRNQPEKWNGLPNPMAVLPHQTSPSANHAAPLFGEPGHTMTATLSKHARKLLRQKESRLHALGAVAHHVAGTEDEADRLVDIYADWKRARAATTGTPPPSEAQLALLRQACRPLALSDVHIDGRLPSPLAGGGSRRRRETDEGPGATGSPSSAPSGHFLPQGEKGLAPEMCECGSPPGGGAPVELHALLCGAEPVAILGGAGHRGRFSGMVLAFDPRPDIARCSPGELLVKAVMEILAARGFSTFDLGIGEARYKDTFCKTPEPLFDSFLGMSLRGRAAAAVWAGLGGLKRRVKGNETVWRRLKILSAGGRAERSAPLNPP